MNDYYYKEIPYFSNLYKYIYLFVMLLSGAYLYYEKRNIIICTIITLIFILIFFTILYIINTLLYEKIIIYYNNDNLELVFFNKKSPKKYIINFAEVIEYKEERYRTINSFFSKGKMIFIKKDNSIIEVPYLDFYYKLRDCVLKILENHNQITQSLNF